MGITGEYLAELCDAFAECIDVEDSEKEKLGKASEAPFGRMSEYCPCNHLFCGGETTMHLHHNGE